ncbi:MAG: hypothetical protein A4E73_01296 [Syntrophaceae bacterium PtaU1.Bin231]|nr:MAG: hypothetical protein A4E73_01296 [Syntrophaceae bacterium PtaU1.Bin231]HOG17544.1 FixH family protein [Syntrophales bacterium]
MRSPTALFAAATAAVVLAWAAAPLPAVGGGMAADCAIDLGPCLKQLPETGLTVAFDITPKPVATMKTVVFRVDLKQGGVPVTDGDVAVDLSMPRMTMAPNTVKLSHQGNGIYRGRGVIVKCPSGDGLWQADTFVRHPARPDGSPQRAWFTFRVK